MDISKIPFLKNLDMSNAQTKKSVLMFLAAIIGLIVILILNLASGKKEEATVMQATSATTAGLPPIQDGDDNDNLEGKTLIEVRQRKDNGSFARRIFEDGVSPEDILRTTDGVPTDRDKESSDLLSAAGSVDDIIAQASKEADERYASYTENDASLATGMSNQTTQSGGASSATPRISSTPRAAPAQASSTSAASSASSATSKPSPQTPSTLKTQTASRAVNSTDASSPAHANNKRIQAARQAVIDLGYNPDTGMPLTEEDKVALGITEKTSPAGVGSAQGPAGSSTSVVPDGVEKSVVSVRGKGSMSSFGTGSESGTGSGFSSFGSTEHEAVSSGAKFFKVAFAYDEKIKAGQRVTLRLREKITINGYELPLNSIVYATSAIEGERLALKVKNVDINGKAFFLNYDAVDVDWERGLYCPTKESTKKVKQAVQEGIQIVSSAAQGIITGIPGRALASGTSMATNTDGEVTVSVREGYEFYLIPAGKDN